MSRDLRLPEVTRNWRDYTGTHVEFAVEGWKLAYTVRFTSYKPVARRRRQSRDRKSRHVISGDRKRPGSDVIWLKSSGSSCRRPKIGVYCTFHFLQGCSSQDEAVTSQEMTSRDLRWPEWPRSAVICRKTPGSGCKSPKTGIYCTFYFLQGCSSQEEAVISLRTRL